MKKTIYYLFLYTISSNYLYAKAPLETQKSQSTAAQQAQQDAKQAQLLAQEAELKKEQAAQEAQKAQKLKELTQQAELLGIQSTIDVINLSGKTMTIYGVMQNGSTVHIGAFEEHEIPAQSMKIPSGVVSITVQDSTNKSNTFPLINGLPAITIRQVSSIGSNTFKIEPLVPNKGTNLLLYNALSQPHTIVISYAKKTSGSFFDYIKDVTNNTTTVSYTVEPQKARTITVPDTYNNQPITHITFTDVNPTVTIPVNNITSYVIHQQSDKTVYTPIAHD